MIPYRYSIEGTAGGGQTWHTEGEVNSANAGAFLTAIDVAMRSSFMKLTRGEAVYGLPGVGCVGPYRVTKLTMQEIEQ